MDAIRSVHSNLYDLIDINNILAGVAFGLTIVVISGVVSLFV